MSLAHSLKAMDVSVPPEVSQDLWTETADRKTKTALRAVSDEILAAASAAITIGLPRKIVELSDIIDRSQSDETSIFHAKWDTRWHSPTNHVLSPTSTLSTYSVVGVSSADIGTVIGCDSSMTDGPKSPTTTTTTRRFSISQQCGTGEMGFSLSVSVFRPPTHIIQLWEVLDKQTRNLIELFDLIQMFLILKTPVAEEDGGVSSFDLWWAIFLECARTLGDARRFVVGCENYLKLYHTQRAKLASKCLKYPQLEDYQRALVERDHEECRDCRYLLTRLRIQCLAVVDILHKNFEKVDDPKGLNRGGGTVGMY